MAKLNQIIAVRDGKKSRAKETLTGIYHLVQKSALFDGISRTYEPDNDDGERFPPEHKQVQYTVGRAIAEACGVLSELFDVTATQDYANCKATADIAIDGKILAAGVPVTHLLFIEKQLIDVQTFVRSLPTLDPAEKWEYSQTADCYQSESHGTAKSKKIPKAFVKYDATKEFPAQVEVFQEDVKVGEWNTIKFSGAMPLKEKVDTLNRIAVLIDAVKAAREQANGIDAPPVSISAGLFGYIFAK